MATGHLFRLAGCGLVVAGLAILPCRAAELPALDRSIAEAISTPRKGAPLAAALQRAYADTTSSERRNAIAQREAVTAALDEIARGDADGGGVGLTEANLLVGVFRSLDAIRQVEAGKGIENDVPTVIGAVWRRYVAPLVARSTERALQPAAALLTGDLVGQWIDGGKTVRAFDLWADSRAKSLNWSRVEFATPLPRVDALLERDLVSTPRPPRPRLALYVDLAALREGDRTAVRRAAAGGDGRLLFVLDDSQKRLAECLAADVPRRETVERSRRDAKADEEDEARCRARIRPEVDPMLLFDPKRQLQVRRYNPTDPAMPVARILVQAAGLAKVWP
ncbi:hypothetical protein NS228_25730 [Methylobacterium indicum]|uniref:hypothetical protein n=1 Tax=Methylobacterium indicum TaxID=1775910 RepID=UPI000733CF94|nr:hypothetical protein [Methylobacterium indicum]KTS25031.1 hypothetical protein NS229_20685 [Methylobacterium indicum]KTS25736.1 hypothetical protein NS228_25730 [Methylobacterium indicum]KTS44577.1 hypothetical protein NS230_25200 [Methylobacterium indicum]